MDVEEFLQGLGPMARSRRVTKRMIQDAIKFYVPYVGLSDWSWDVNVERLGEQGPYAAVSYSPSIEHFVLCFNTSRFGSSGVNERDEDWLDEFRRLILHELVHVRMSPVMDAYESKLAEILGEKVRDIFTKAVYNMEDSATDRLAKTLRDHLPPFQPKWKG